jgi:CRP-like cAMP-binding protein
MLTVCESPIARKFTAAGTLSTVELGILSDIHRRRRRFRSGTDFGHNELPNRSLYILASGWGFTYILLPDGSRQIIDFRIPGDIIGWGSLVLPKSDRMVAMITSAEASEVLEADVLSTFVATPGLVRGFLLAASRDESVAAERLAGLGRRQASERIAHFLLELAMRLKAVGLCGKQGFSCPLTQYHLADALGLTPVHVNRVLRDLREDGLVTFQKGKVTFDDFDSLVLFANFDGAYLDCTLSEPRRASGPDHRPKAAERSHPGP